MAREKDTNKPQLPLHAGAESHLFKNAKELRKEQTNAEEILWTYLRSRKFLNLKFRRQHPILEFIADFYCHELKLVIEVDGKYHQTDEMNYHDQERTKVLMEMGYQVIRFTNEEIFSEISEVLDRLEEVVSE